MRVDQGLPCAAGFPEQPASAKTLGAPKTVFVHVGAPKTGTTFLQEVLWRNRGVLAQVGFGYPLDDPDEHFAAAMDLRQMAWGGQRDPAWDGAWQRVAERARRWSGPGVVISNELLGGASAEQIRHAVQTLQPADVRIVFSARDLARQLPSDWQEQVKHTHTVTLDTFVDDLINYGIEAPEPFGEMFWALHDPVHVLRRWADVVGADHVHIVTVAQPGGSRELLWQRFAGVLGIEASLCDTDVRHANSSLGAVETELLRRANAHGNLGHRLGKRYDAAVRVGLAEDVLARRPAARPIPLPLRHSEWVAKRSREMVEGLRAAGYSVTGDLADLEPRPPHAMPEARDPGAVTDGELLDAALDAIVGLLTRGAEPSAEPVPPPSQPAPPRPVGPVRRAVHAASERSVMVARMRAMYWHLASGLRRLTRHGREAR